MNFSSITSALKQPRTIPIIGKQVATWVLIIVVVIVVGVAYYAYKAVKNGS